MSVRPSHWLHDRTTFYKYLSPAAAQDVLEFNSFHWSAPTEFNDPFDIGFDLHVDYEPSTIAKEIVEAQWAVYQGIDTASQTTSLGRVFNELKLNRPGISRAEFDAKLLSKAQGAIARLDGGLPDLHSKIKRLLGTLKVLCLAEKPDNILMWSHYCLNHTGIVLEARCIAALDSVWGMASPVSYSARMPRLLDHAELIAYLAGKFPIEDKLKLDRIVMTKAVDWSYENEWRILHYGTSPDEKFITKKFSAYEISGIYVGCRCLPEFRQKIIELRNLKYPHADLYQAKKAEREFKIEFEKMEAA